MAQICVGYDLRLASKELLTATQNSFRDQFLVDRHFHRSGDPSVWPRPANVDCMLNGQANIGRNPLGLIVNESSLIEIRSIGSCSPISVAMSCDHALIHALEERFGPTWIDISLTDTLLQSQGWSFVGFDVLDLVGLISGLNGCGYNTKSKEALAKVFADHCNAVGLFESRSIASRFAEVRSFQIQSHAPFVPVAIYVQREDIVLE